MAPRPEVTSRMQPEPRGSAPLRPESAAVELEATEHDTALAQRAALWWRAQRWVLLGMGVSLPIHLLLMIWLAAIVIDRPQPVAGAVRGVEVALLPEIGLDRLLEARLPDPTQPPIDAASGDSDPLDLPDEPVGGGSAAPRHAGGLLATGAGDASSGPGVGRGRGDPGLGGGTGGTSFFGVRARGTRFGYVIDKSGSMAHDGRWQRLATELMRSLQELPATASFCVAFFDTSARAFPAAKEGWERARRGGVDRFQRWARQASPGGGTEPIYGFDHLLSLDVSPDAIFFMTDGEIPPEQASSILAKVVRRARPIAIHCIQFQDRTAQTISPEELSLADIEIEARLARSSAVGPVDRLATLMREVLDGGAPRGLAPAMRERLNERLLRELAEETGGAYRLVPAGGNP